MRKLLLIAVAALALAACATPERVRAQMEKNCESFGFKRDTTEFAECVEREHARWRESKPAVIIQWTGNDHESQPHESRPEKSPSIGRHSCVPRRVGTASTRHCR